jgi:adenosylcobinamide-phosphate synthase
MVLVDQRFLLGVTVVFLSLTLDYALGEPPDTFHPTVWMGRAAETLHGALCSRRLCSKLWGAVYTLVLDCAATSTTLLALGLVSHYVGDVLWLLMSAYVLKLSYALRSLEEHVEPVGRAVASGDVALARKLVQRVVRRPTRDLDACHIVSAAVETTAEGLVDGVCSPFFYYALFGVPGAMCYRSANTLDSTVGYRTPALANFGWASAKIDTYMNYLPARLTGFLIVASAFILGYDWRNGLRVMLRDHANTPSRNGGWPMAAMAGCLRIRLEKLGEYVLGDPVEEPAPHKIVDALRVAKVSAALFCVFVVIPLVFVNVWVAWWVF